MPSSFSPPPSEQGASAWPANSVEPLSSRGVGSGFSAAPIPVFGCLGTNPPGDRKSSMSVGRCSLANWDALMVRNKWPVCPKSFSAPPKVIDGFTRIGKSSTQAHWISAMQQPSPPGRSKFGRQLNDFFRKRNRRRSGRCDPEGRGRWAHHIPAIQSVLRTAPQLFVG